MFTFLFMIGYCNSIEERIINPKDLNDAKNQSLVGFLIVDDLNNDSEDPSSMMMKVYPIRSTGMVLYDLQTKNTVESLSLDKNPIQTVEEDGNKVTYSNRLDSFKGIFLVDPRKDYYLGYVQWYRFCNHCNNPTLYRINLKPEKSFSTLKIKGKPGEIVFLGVYRIGVTEEGFKIENFIENKEKKMDYTFNRILANSSFWEKDFRDYGIWSEFEREEGYNERSAEIKFLKTIIETQQKGYWREKAEARLKVLLSSK